VSSKRQIDLSESELRRYVTHVTDRTASDGDLFKALIRAHLLAEGAELFEVLRALVEQASAMQQQTYLHPDNEKLDVLEEWMAQRAWITECLADAIVRAPPRMKAAGDRVIQQIDETTSRLRVEANAERFGAGSTRAIVVSHPYQFKKRERFKPRLD
jgi:hypothetical protein